MDKPTESVVLAQGESIKRDMNSFMLNVHSVYDVGRALPHPYDAIGDMSSALLHDFRSFAFKLEGYINRIEGELRTDSATPTEEQPS